MAKKAKKVKKIKKIKKVVKEAKRIKKTFKARTLRSSKKIVPQIFTTKTVKAAPAAKEKAEPPLTDAQIQKFRDYLSQKRDELFDVVQRKKEQEIQVGEVEIGDEADIATRSVEKEMLFELTDSEKQTLDMIEAALRKIEKGVYGRCESCRRNISRGRMEVMPWARYCIRCQAENEIPSNEPTL